MKKYILTLSLIVPVLFGVKVNAQQKGSIWLNVVTGVNSTWILNQNAYGNQEMEYGIKFGYTGGVGVSYFHDRNWGFNGSLLTSQLGQNYAGYQGGAEAVRKVKLLYLEVPLLVMKNIPDMLNPTWISFGPDVMLLLNAKQDYSRDGGSPLPNPEGMISGDTRDRFKTADVALNLSLNRMYTMNYSRKMMFLISLNSSLGLTDINKSAWQIPNTHDYYGKSHNFYIGIKVGMMFKLSRYGGGHW
jgi:hypothetical protein